MRMSFFLFALAIFQLSATESHSQNTKLTLHAENARIADVLSEIEVKSEFYFLYSPNMIDVERRVNLQTVEKPLKEILGEIFRNDVVYAVNERQIILTPSKQASDNENTARQQQLISGRVTDAATGEGMPGVNIQVKGTTLGAITDIDGRFSLPGADRNATLVFSFIGYVSQEIPLGGRAAIDVKLVGEVKGLEEVVVIGYGTVKKSDLTGSVTSISSDNLSRGVVVAPHQAMQGKVTGVNVTLNGGEPGANSTVLIRGGTSITASNAPLYVIDGVPVAFDESGFSATSTRQTSRATNPLNMINSADIKSINILKDASATAIYGSRGANGVIIITTKQGAAGSSKISYDAFVGVSTVRKKIDVLSADEFRSYIASNPQIATGWVDGGANTDWQDEIYRTALNHSNSIAISGGNSQTNYRASFSYSSQEGIVLNSDLTRLIGRVNINHKTLNDRLEINLNLAGAGLNNNTGANPESTGSQFDGGIIRDALGQDPTYPVKDANGKYTFRGVLNLNPVEQANTLIDLTETYRNLGNMVVTLKLTNSLKFSNNLGFTKEFVNRNFYAPITSQVGSNSHGQGSQQTRNNFSKLLESNLLYSKTFNKLHDINAILGYSFEEFFYTNSYIMSSNFITDANTYNNLGAGVTQNPVSTGKSSNRLISFFGRATYGFSNKYLLTATVRRDGSSRFGVNNKWGIFPSAALAWKLSEESFLKDNKIISNLKLRAGYGVTGNQGIGNYRSLSTLSSGGSYYIIGGNILTAVGPNQNYNPDLKWESTAQVNLGVDFGFLKDRITGAFDLYQKRTRDLLLSFSVPSPAEVSTILANVGGVENKGFEFELNGIAFSNEKFQAEIYGNLSYNKNEVTALSNDTWKTEVIYTGGVRAAGYSGFTCQIIQPGEPLGTFYGYKYVGVTESGSQQFEDLNNDGQILIGTDRTVLGSYNPDFLYGFGTRLNYKSFSFDCFFRGVSGVEILNSTALELQNKTRIPAFNVSAEALTDGLTHGVSNVFSSQFLHDGSFLRLDNATLGYNVNLKSPAISKLFLYVTGQNLFVLTKYIGYDPEVNGGIDYMNYPQPRNLILGLSVEF